MALMYKFNNSHGSLSPSLQGRVYVVKGEIYPQSSTGPKELAPPNQLSLYDGPVNVHIVEPPGQVTLRAIVHGHDNASVIELHMPVKVRYL
jgi:hypothetical protein